MAGASVAATDARGRTPLHLAAQSSRPDLLNRLLAAGAAAQATDANGTSVLAYAVLRNSTANVARLCAAGAPVDGLLSADRSEDRATMDGRLCHRAICTSPLIWAARHDRVDMVATLLAAGANPEQNVDRWTALRAAASHGHADVVGVLLQGGATAAELALGHLGGLPPLIWATSRGYPAVVAQLLEAGASPDTTEKSGRRWTALRHAVAIGDLSVVKLLLEAEAAVDLREPVQMRKAMYVASRTGQAGVVQRLLAGGASVDAAPDVEGWTPLMWACHGYLPIVKALLAAKASPHIMAVSGESALKVSSEVYLAGLG